MIKFISAVALVLLLLTGAWLVMHWWAGWRLARAEDAFEAVVGPLDPAAYAPATADPASPTGAWVEEALRRYDAGREDEKRIHELVRRPPVQWTDEERRLVARLAEEQGEALDLLRRAGPRLSDAPFPELYDFGEDHPEPPVDLTALLRASKLLLARAGFAMESAPSDGAADLAALGGIADAVERQPETVYVLVGTALEKLFLHGARWAAADPGMPPEAIAAVLDAVPRATTGERFSAAMARSAARSATMIEREMVPLHGLERLAPWLRDLAQVSTLDAFRRMAEASGDPLTLATTGEQMRRERSLGAIGASLLIPNMVDALYKARALDASRRVGRLALELRLHREPGAGGGSSPAKGFVGARPPQVQVTGRDDGSVLLRDPAAQAAWEERWGTQTYARPPPYEWELPPRLSPAATR